MSDTMTAASPGGAPKVSRINEAVIRIAGNSQDGIQAIGGFLARLAGRSEQEVMRSEEHTAKIQSLRHLVCRLLLEKKKAREMPMPKRTGSAVDWSGGRRQE